MVHTCFLCKWRSDRDPRRSFHQFPPDAKERQKWLEIIGKSNEKIGKCTSLCSIHFEESCFRYGLVFNKRILKKGSLPSLNLTRNEGQNNANGAPIVEKTPNPPNFVASQGNSNRGVKRPAEQNIKTPTQQPCLERINHPVPVIISTISIQELNLLKEQLAEKNKQLRIHNYHLTKYKYQLEEKKKKVATLRKQVFRLNKTKIKLQEVVKNSKKKIRIGKEKIEEETLGPILKSLLSQVKQNKKKVHEYPNDLKLFATTISFLSPPAYKYIKAVLPSLPTASTIRKWLNEIKIEPGLCNTSFNILKAKVIEANKLDKKLLCNVVMDNITVRKHLRLNGKRYSGAESKLFPSSKETMVIMIVCINEDWKIPVAHYFVDELSAKDRADLLLECLKDLHSTGIIVTSLTIDSGSSNMMMAKHLGLDIRSTADIDKHFQHPVTEQPVYVMIDICQAMRLVRNALADKGMILDANGDAIKWKYFKLLVKYQYRYGLHVGTKIRKSHVNFARDKTNVKLATQILSNGVSHGLQFLRTVTQLPEFSGSYATEAFCTVMNDIFDLLNFRRALKNTPLKGLINRDNITEVRTKIIEYEYYIKSLRDSGNESVLDGNRKTGFIGLLISLRSVLAIFDKYSSLDENTFKNLPTYKLSQDHFDLYLTNLRSREVRHNNPTEEQFQTAFKKHLVFAQVGAPDYTSCLAPESTCLMQSNKRAKSTNVIVENNVSVSENHLAVLEEGENVVWGEYEITTADQDAMNIVSSDHIQDSGAVENQYSEENILILTLD